MKKHLLLKGKDVTVPLCGSTEVGKVATFNHKNATCEECLTKLKELCKVDSFVGACALVGIDSDNWEEHNIVDQDSFVYILGTKDEFWKSIQKIQLD